ncbi:Endoplasmin [Armadillidium vulgare]|nr:Endoplasmin [Armadillidium vulgare]
MKLSQNTNGSKPSVNKSSQLGYSDQFHWLNVERGLFVLAEKLVTLHTPPTKRRIENTRLLFLSGLAKADDPGSTESPETVENDLGASREGSRTDDEVVAREEEAIKLDGLNVSQVHILVRDHFKIKELREKSDKFQFQAEVNRMMKLIINSLYRNKEIFLRELISNASDALDKIRLLSLTEKGQLDSTSELSIKIKADKDNHVLHITDTGIGMTKDDLINNLGTIAKSGTSEFFSKLQDTQSSSEANDLIGQFGVGFYSAFLVADRVVVTTKHNDDKQYIWESDSSQFSIVEDPRGNTLGRGSTISLYLKEEAYDFVEVDTVKTLIKKYSQFINFPIYLWESKTEEVEEPIEDDEEEEKAEDKDKPKTKKVTKTTWDWTLVNDSKPIWTRKPADITDEEYIEFYKNLAKDSKEPLAKTHFIAEGEVTFKSLLFVPQVQPGESFNKYGTKTDSIKLYVRRVFITDDFQSYKFEIYLRERKREYIENFRIFINVYNASNNFPFSIKLGVIEDSANRNRLAKLLRFLTSSHETEMASLEDYVERMKEKQDHIYYMAGASRKEVESSPFVERLLKKGFEVLYLTEAIDEYAVNALPEFEGKKFQNVAKEGLTIDEGAAAKERMEQLKTTFEPLTKWLADEALKEKILKAEISERLDESPCALVTSRFGWTGNMERIVTSQTHAKSQDVQRDYYLSQKKTLEVNPRHPLIKELLKRVQSDPADAVAKNIATMMFRTATLRSGYILQDTVEFAKSVEELMRETLGVPVNEPVEEEPELEETEEEPEEVAGEEEDETEDSDSTDQMRDEL